MLKIVKNKAGQRTIVDKDGKRWKLQSENTDEELMENLAELVKQLKLKKRRNRKRAAKKKVAVDSTPIMSVSAASNIDKLRIEQLSKQLDLAVKNNIPLTIQDGIKADLELASNRLKTLIDPKYYPLVTYLLSSKSLIDKVRPEYTGVPINYILSTITPAEAEKLRDDVIKIDTTFTPLSNVRINEVGGQSSNNQQASNSQSNNNQQSNNQQASDNQPYDTLSDVDEVDMINYGLHGRPADALENLGNAVDNIQAGFAQLQQQQNDTNELNVDPNTAEGKCGSQEKGLNGIEINEMLADLAPVYKGTVAADKLSDIKVDQPVTAFIMNTSPSSQPTGHWVAVIIGPHIEYYDSFGTAPSNRILKQLKELSGDTPKQLKINKVKFQECDSANCGWFCCKFLLDRLFHGRSFKEATGFNIVEDHIAAAGEDMIEDFKEKILADQFGDL